MSSDPQYFGDVVSLTVGPAGANLVVHLTDRSFEVPAKANLFWNGKTIWLRLLFLRYLHTSRLQVGVYVDGNGMVTSLAFVSE